MTSEHNTETALDPVAEKARSGKMEKSKDNLPFSY